mgnify:CR=1 FL=1
MNECSTCGYKGEKIVEFFLRSKLTNRQKKLWLTPEAEKEQLERQCIKRMLYAEDIAKVVLFFASDQSSGCTAQNYVIDGGVVN